MKKLVEDGHKVYAVCPRGDKFDLFDEEGIEAVEYNIERSSLNPLKELKAIYNIYHALKPLKLDMLHTFTAKPNIYGTLAGKMAKVPTIINLVEGLGSFYLEDSVKNIVVRTLIEKLYKLVFLMSDKVVFVNADDPAYLESKGVIKKSQIQVIKSVGIDTAAFDPNLVNKEQIEALRDELQIGSKTVVLMVARAIWHKGVREYYEAAKLLADDKNVQFVLVGDTDEGNPSSADESFLNSGNVLWLGHRDDVLELTAMADIYVLPSYREGVPRTLLEAASMAKPIITTDTVGCREVVKNGENGFLVPIKDSNSLANQIETLLNDVSRRKLMGENGRIRAIREFDVQRVVEQYLELYEELVLKKGTL
jgi:N,N'-diacetylbacillosaminyl-diphospho-undecaprenol alpha-1,3-N-acetylgalactosaminyltransferase